MICFHPIFRGNAGMIEFEIPVPPSANALYANRKYGRGRGRGRVKTAAYRSWITAAGACIPVHEVTDQRPAIIWLAVPYSGRRDLDNYAKPIMDLLTAHKVLQNDTMKWVRGISLTAVEGRKTVRVTIERIGNDGS